MKEKIERNKTILKKKEAGVTYRKLSIEYNLSINTLVNIVTRERKKLLVN